MLSRYLRSSLLLLVAAGVAFAQTADDYYHMAARQYINGDYALSKRTVQEALVKYPQDPKLNALKKKIKEPPPQDQNQQQQNQRQQQQQAKPQPQQGQISKDQAARILQALQNKEKENLKKQQRPSEQQKVDKDW